MGRRATHAKADNIDGFETVPNSHPSLSGNPKTDLGNAERFVDQHGHDARYCHLWGKWLVWDGSRWILDEVGWVEAKMKATVRNIYREAAESEDSQERKALAEHAN